MKGPTAPLKPRRKRRGRRRLGVAALLGVGVAVLVSNRDRLRGLVRSDAGEASTGEPIFTSVGMASTSGAESAPTGGDAEAPGAAPSSESPGTTAPPL